MTDVHDGNGHIPQLERNSGDFSEVALHTQRVSSGDSITYNIQRQSVHSMNSRPTSRGINGINGSAGPTLAPPDVQNPRISSTSDAYSRISDLLEKTLQAEVPAFPATDRDADDEHSEHLYAKVNRKSEIHIDTGGVASYRTLPLKETDDWSNKYMLEDKSSASKNKVALRRTRSDSCISTNTRLVLNQLNDAIDRGSIYLNY